ncbi:MAG: DEAD/DEAH box helicase [Nanoarchaeota archaeon]|nr:DEAD/DEAH box helicase [Nanoarchaeota archaeon]
MIKDFKPRMYQESILATCAKKNTLVVLPTGLGKTNIFLMLAAHRLKLYPTSKILFIGPTRPLIDQYLSVFEKHFNIPKDQLVIFTGHVKPEKRAELWKTAKIIFSTPQGLENDILNRRINLEDVCLLGIDEAHRAVGDYAYVWVAKQYEKTAKYARILGLTASPGSDLEKIGEVCQNLFVQDIEVRTDKDSDVAEYLQQVEVDWIKVKLPKEFDEVLKHLKDFLKSRLNTLKDWDIMPKQDTAFVSKTALLQLQAQLRGRAVGTQDFTAWKAISVLAEIMKIQHAVELLETQGVKPLHDYLNKLQQDSLSSKTKAVKNIVADIEFRNALFKTNRLFGEKVQHPKIAELKKLVKEILVTDDAKLMVFNQYRDNAADIVTHLNTLEGVRATLFVGQMKKGDTGLSQKEQKAVLDKFRSTEFNILVSTSVGEEGIDVPSVDAVIFFEPVPSAIRTIQRRGRTGRQSKGRVLVLMAENTRDVGYRWSAHHKELRMHRTLETLKKKMNFSPAKKPTNKSLEAYTKDKEVVKMYVDHREKGSAVIKQLIDKGVHVQLEQLSHADYLLSKNVGVEYKTAEDFVNSIIDGRLLDQLRMLKNQYTRPLVLIEGEDLYSIRNIHPNAIRGMIVTIVVTYGIPILFSKYAEESASLLLLIAKREQSTDKSDFTPHATKRTGTLKEMQEYLVAALPGVGITLAKPLLTAFKSIKNLVNASEEELQQIDKIGSVKAKKIKEVLDKEYEL